jgi:hypothetical protein
MFYFFFIMMILSAAADVLQIPVSISDITVAILVLKCTMLPISTKPALANYMINTKQE